MFELTVRTEFSAAHRLRGYKGACENFHGHNWKIDVVLAAPRLDRLGMVVDFKDVKAALAEVVGALDHRYLNEIPPFDRLNPTTEQIARHIAQALGPRLPRGVRLKSVTSWESDRCGATYCPSARTRVTTTPASAGAGLRRPRRRKGTKTRGRTRKD